MLEQLLQHQPTKDMDNKSLFNMKQFNELNCILKTHKQSEHIPNFELMTSGYAVSWPELISY